MNIKIYLVVNLQFYKTKRIKNENKMLQVVQVPERYFKATIGWAKNVVKQESLLR